MRKLNQRARTFCGRLREIRKARGLSLTEAERDSGIPRSTISKLESGRLINPTLRTLLLGYKLYGLALQDWADLLLLDDDAISTTAIDLLEEVLTMYDLDVRCLESELPTRKDEVGIKYTIRRVQSFIVARNAALANPQTPSEAEKLSLEYATQWLDEQQENHDPVVRNHAKRLVEFIATKSKELYDVD